MVDQAQQEEEDAEREAQEVRRLMEIDNDEEIEALRTRSAPAQHMMSGHSDSSCSHWEWPD